jgi:hypothetical protein
VGVEHSRQHRWWATQRQAVRILGRSGEFSQSLITRLLGISDGKVRRALSEGDSPAELQEPSHQQLQTVE